MRVSVQQLSGRSIGVELPGPDASAAAVKSQIEALEGA